MKKIKLMLTALIASAVLFCGCGSEKKDNSSYVKHNLVTTNDEDEVVTDEENDFINSFTENFSINESHFINESNIQIEDVTNDSSIKQEIISSKSSGAKEKSPSIVVRDESSFVESRQIIPELSSETETMLGPAIESVQIIPELSIETERILGPAIVDEITTSSEDLQKEETTSQIEREYVVYKPSTHYIHRSTCYWVTDECYKIDNTNDVEARKCTECNPNMEIINKYIEKITNSSENYWNGPVLTPYAGVVYGPSGKETYYNLNMNGVINIMRGMGFDSITYPYWVRSDGCKMLGSYIMCAANLNVHPRGSLVESSLGTCIVCDTGGFAYNNPNQLDLATTW